MVLLVPIFVTRQVYEARTWAYQRDSVQVACHSPYFDLHQVSGGVQLGKINIMLSNHAS